MREWNPQKSPPIQCPRCPRTVNIWDMRREWTGLRVCVKCYDPKHESLKPIKAHVPRPVLNATIAKFENAVFLTPLDTLISAYGISNPYFDTAIPHNAVAPVVTGTRGTGNTLSVTSGAWTGNNANYYVYVYRWVNGTDGVIAGAVHQTYVLQASDLGDPIYCKITVTNSKGFGSATSNTV